MGVLHGEIAMTDRGHLLDKLFYPRAVGVVGAKRANNFSWLRNHMHFAGPKYHVNIDEQEWLGADELGYQTYRSVREIPGPVDYVTITVPNTVVPRILEDCAAKGVAGVHIFATLLRSIPTGDQLEAE
jgi:acetyltransferase